MICEFVINNIGTRIVYMCRKQRRIQVRGLFLAYSTVESIIMNTARFLVGWGWGGAILLLRDVQTASHHRILSSIISVNFPSYF